MDGVRYLYIYTVSYRKIGTSELALFMDKHP
jgi:hypothetical protein